MFRRKKKQEQIPQQPKIHESGWKLLDFSPIKDFINYGLNKTLINLKLRRLKDIEVREELHKGGKPKDWTQVMITVVVIIIVGVLAFTIINQFMNYTEVAKEIVTLNQQLGTCTGKLAQYSQQAADAASEVIIG